MNKAGRFSREGKVIDFDVIDDKVENANMVLIGQAGTGKTVNLVEKMLDSVEKHNSRLVIVEAGNSYDLLVTALEEEGKSIQRFNFDAAASKQLSDALVYQEKNIDEVVADMSLEMAGKIICSDGKMQDVLHFNVAELMRDYKGKERLAAVVSIISGVAGCLDGLDSHVRPTVVACDEFHYLLNGNCFDALIPTLTNALAVLNGLNAWVWLASQNIGDIHHGAIELLNKFEWWEILRIDEFEIERLKNFRALSYNEVCQLKSLEIRRREFVESLILPRTGQEAIPIFRYSPKSISLALSMMDPFEKKHRTEIMKELNVSELGAAYEIARRLDIDRGIPC